MGRGEHLEEKQPIQRPRRERRLVSQEAVMKSTVGAWSTECEGDTVDSRPGGSCGSEMSGNGGHIRDFCNFARTNGKSFKDLNIVHVCVIRLF